MESRIAVLPRDIADKIAAGEVIERPASIVKELLENAFDAGARDILIELEGGGKESIRVVDNGSGIDGRDVETAFERHATSKIRQAEDIYQISTFGFRGEALPSIAAVSDLELLTRKRGELSGVRVLLQGGKIKELTDIGCPEGTTISVRNIFRSIPARRKFLKKDSVEQAYCLEVVTRMALVQPDIRIRVLSNGRTVFNIPRTREIAERISLILGMDFGQHMIPVKGEREGIHLHGFVSRPDFTRSSAKNIYIYVNGRYVRDHLIQHAVLNAFRSLIEPRKYPSAVLFIELPPEDVDVNVHPAKTEVRFRDSKKVYETVIETIALALNGSAADSLPVQQESSGYLAEENKAGRQFSNETPKRYFVSTGAAKLYFQPGLETAVHSPAAIAGNHASVPEVQESRGFFSSLAYIGQIGGTYLIFAGMSNMILIDQHAAHERILFEKLKKGAGSRQPTDVQTLLIPEVVPLSAADCALIADCQEIFMECGIDLTILGGDTVAVKTLPVFVQAESGTLIKDILSEISELGKVHSLDQLRDKIHAALACKSAVKAKERLSEREIIELCHDLDRIPNFASCPHGRPVYIEFSMRDLGKMFKRT